MNPNQKLVYGGKNDKGPQIGDEYFKRKYGLLRIEDKINKSSADLSVLYHGIDLTTFGLNLNSANDQVDTFGSPFDIEPKLPFLVSVPKCYTKFNQPIAIKNLPKLQEKTLFFVFYNYEDKETQINAAKLLMNTGWKYNVRTLLWYSKYDPTKPKTHVQIKFFNPRSWAIEDCEQDELKKEEFATQKDFEQFR